MRIILASLPGAIYLPFGFCGGHVTFKGWVAVRALPPINSIEERRLAHTQLALRLREKYDLGNANLAWVSGLEWQAPGGAPMLCVKLPGRCRGRRRGCRLGAWRTGL